MKTIILDGLTYELVLVEPEPEPAPEWGPRVGELCEFWDDNIEFAKYGVFLQKNQGDFFPFIMKIGPADDYYAECRGCFKHCRPLQDPNIIQMIPWKGGKCPVPNDVNVLMHLRGGGDVISRGYNYDWTHLGSDVDIIAYAALGKACSEN